jgi:Xaa-Pro aminopeptidase
MWGPKMLERPPAIPREEYQERCRRAAAAAKERGLDGLLVWSIGGSRLDSFCDVFYLTNHYATESKTVNLLPHWTGFGHAAAILAIDADPVLCVHKPDWRVDLVAVEDVRGSSDLYALILDSMRELGLTGGRIGLAREEYVPLPFYHALRERFPGAQLVAADEILDEMRLVKSSAEIAHMRHASAVSVEVMNAMLGAAEVGRTDGDLASIGFRVATEHGATPWEFAMASGPHADHMWWGRLPAFDPRRLYERGDIVHPDVYGCVDGYFYDFVRSCVVGGSATEAQRELLEASIAVGEFVCARMRPGRRACDVHAEGVAFVREHGWDRGEVAISSLPFFGHGIGLTWEGPWIMSTDATALEPGMTVAVEIVFTGHGTGAAYEEAVLVTDDEPEIMTAGCKQRWWT